MSNVKDAVAEYTGTEADAWELIGVGDPKVVDEFWFFNEMTEQTVYVCKDQDTLTLSLIDDE